MTLSEVLTTRRVRRWAGSRSYERGEDYFHGGHVSDLKAVKGRITATVHGTHPYRVMLRDEGDGVGYECDCPVGLRGDFCKHCVATALAWLERRALAGKKGKGGRKKKADKGLTMQDMRAWLLLQKKESLVDMLIAAATDDDQLSGRLMLKAAAASGVSLATYKKVIDQAIGGGGFIDYHQMYDYWRGVDTAIDAIAELLAQKHADAVIELSEHALSRVEHAIGSVDDSDGYMSLLLSRLQEMHLAACRMARPDPEALAERLFEWELHGEWDTFFDSVNSYAPVLGKCGTRRYQELAEAEWARIKPLKPGEQDPDRYGKRFRITRMMENLTEQSGDIEALVEIKKKDLSNSRVFLEIAEIYRRARQGDQSLEWAKTGIQTFGDNAGSALQNFLAELYHQRKRHEDAMALIWPQFEKNPCLTTYRHLKNHADCNKTWPGWRNRALQHLRAVTGAKARNGFPNRYAPWNNGSRLVEIFLWEKDIESAWQEAKQGGCDERLWIRLAGLREEAYPRDAIAVYQQLIGPIVNRTNNDAYAEAIGLLQRVKKLMDKLGEGGDFRQYLTRVRAEYRRKRNFIKLLERFE